MSRPGSTPSAAATYVAHPQLDGLRRSSLSGRPLAPEDVVVCHHTGGLLGQDEAAPGDDTLEFVPPIERTSVMRLALGRGRGAGQNGGLHAGQPASQPGGQPISQTGGQNAEAIPTGLHHPEQLHDASVPLRPLTVGAGLLALSGAARFAAARWLDGSSDDAVRAMLSVADAASPGLAIVGLACIGGSILRHVAGRWPERAVAAMPPFLPAAIDVNLDEDIRVSFDFDAGAATPRITAHALKMSVGATPDRLVGRSVSAWFGGGTRGAARADAAVWDAGYLVVDGPPPGRLLAGWDLKPAHGMRLLVTPPARTLSAGTSSSATGRPSVDRFNGALRVAIGPVLGCDVALGRATGSTREGGRAAGAGMGRASSAVADSGDTTALATAERQAAGAASDSSHGVTSPVAGPGSPAPAKVSGPPLTITMSRDPDDPLTIEFTVRMSGLAGTADRAASGTGVAPQTAGTFRVDIGGAHVHDVSDDGRRTNVSGTATRVTWTLPTGSGPARWSRRITLAAPPRGTPAHVVTLDGRAQLSTTGALACGWASKPGAITLVRPDGRRRSAAGEVRIKRTSRVVANISARVGDLTPTAATSARRLDGPRGSLPGPTAATIERAVEREMGRDAANAEAAPHWVCLVDRGVTARTGRSSDPLAVRQVDLQFRVYSRHIQSAPADLIVMVAANGRTAVPRVVVTVDPQLRRGAVQPSPALCASIERLVSIIESSIQRAGSVDPAQARFNRQLTELEVLTGEVTSDPAERQRLLDSIAAIRGRTDAAVPLDASAGRAADAAGSADATDASDASGSADAKRESTP
ncbi:MAG: hypothetical protein AB8G96_16415 [Phycisphaerales bacterium]